MWYSSCHWDIREGIACAIPNSLKGSQLSQVDPLNFCSSHLSACSIVILKLQQPSVTIKWGEHVKDSWAGGQEEIGSLIVPWSCKVWLQLPIKEFLLLEEKYMLILFKTLFLTWIFCYIWLNSIYYPHALHIIPFPDD